jgi:hypothetical protein
MMKLKRIFSRFLSDVRGGYGMTEKAIMIAVLGGAVWLAADILGGHLQDKADESGQAIPTLQGGQ